MTRSESRRTAKHDRVLAIDVGTSSVKAAVLDASAAVLSTGSASQRTISDDGGRSEHVPFETWRRVVKAVERAMAGTEGLHAIRAISVTGPRGSFAIAGSDGRPRTNFLTWQDRRAAARAASLDAALAMRYRAVAGVTVEPSAVVAKLVWLRESVPDVFANDWRVVTPQGFVLSRLGADDFVVDQSVAAHVGLLDVARRQWSDDLLAEFDVPAGALPRLVEPGERVGQLNRAAAEALGLSAGVPLVAAGSDGVCTELGAGVVEPGQLYAYLGTAATVAGPLTSPTLPADRSLILMPGSTHDRWRILGLAGAGGSARAWLMRVLGIRDQRRVERLISTSPPGARGVLFVPTLAGATAPVPDGRARGVFAGLSLASAAEDLARAVHEGVAYELRWLVDRIRRTVFAPTEIRLSGGGSRSNAWSQILADVIGIPVARVVEPNAGLRGAAAYALAATDRATTVLDAARALEPDRDEFLPRNDCGTLYDEAAETYALVRQSFHDGGIDARLFR